MYILVPEAFFYSVERNKIGKKEMVLFSSRTLKTGEKFSQFSGEWNKLTGESENLTRQQLNLAIQEKNLDWMKLVKIEDNEFQANSSIQKCENQNQLEILTDLPTGSLIVAANCSQSFPGRATHSQENLNITSEADSPLDLTWKMKSTISETLENAKSFHDWRATSSNSKLRKLLQCEICNKYFDRPSLLKRHIRTHTGEKPHICEVCQKGFSTSSSLNTHRRIHSGERPHQCLVCGKKFTASSNLYYHKMTHSKEKPHKCQICGKSFPTPGNLKAHQYSHSGHWPYTCKICGRGFGKQTNFRNHQVLHSNQSPP